STAHLTNHPRPLSLHDALPISLSVTDLLVHLYSRTLRVSPQEPRRLERDHLLLSKGHDAPALYATLAEHGFISRRRLDHHLAPRSEEHTSELQSRVDLVCRLLL